MIADLASTLALLSEGELRIEGRLVDATNATFLCRLVRRPAADEAGSLSCVYKPVRGERPLDDFPRGTLAYRERAAYLLSAAAGWDIVPPTVLRDGPLGLGMAQLWIDADPTVDVVEMVLGADRRLRRIAIYDVIANNADRKGSHLLPLPGGHVHGVDHGVCFAVEPKLRTVLWGWRGEALEPAELDVVADVARALAGPLGADLEQLLTPAEVQATARRAARLLEIGRLPHPDPLRPAIPWPPF